MQESSVVRERKWVRREVGFSIQVLFPAKGIRSVNDARFKLCDISEGGASFYVGTVRNIPDFFYMQFGDDKSELHGCYVVGRSESRVHCQFITEIPSADLARIISKNEMNSLLETMFDQPAQSLVDDILLLIGTG